MSAFIFFVLSVAIAFGLFLLICLVQLIKEAVTGAKDKSKPLFLRILIPLAATAVLAGGIWLVIICLR